MTEIRVNMEADWQTSPDAVRRQPEALQAPLAEFLRHVRRDPPNFVLTCARGSSAHAATFGKHLLERHLGLPVGAFAPNIATIYKQRLKLTGQLFITVSQSGRSDDLVESVEMAKAAGALTTSIVNDTESPLARSSDIVLPMAAGPDLGRGPTLAIAREAALKLKETSNLHAEAFSSAEFLHGPIALVEPSYPALVFVPTDSAAAGLHALAADLRRKNARVFMTGEEEGLPALAPDHPDADAVCLIQSFYALAIRLAQSRGINVDLPRHLQKVTRTR